MGNIKYKGGNYTKDTRSSYVQVEPLSVTENGTYTAESGKAYNPVTVNIAPPKSNDVMFYDYDGTVVYSYSATEFADLESMPANPTHEGLTSQGWNWSLSDAKQYVADYGKLNIGQMYITDDGKTRAVIQLEEGRLSPRLGLGINGTVTVDWGDGSATTNMSGNSVNTTYYSTHNYASAGEYVISIDVDGEIRLNSFSNISLFLSKSGASASTDQIYRNSLLYLFIGSNVTFTNYSLIASQSLKNITIPYGITQIPANAFTGCLSLTSIIIPNTVTTLSDYSFDGCNSIHIISIPSTVTTINQYAFRNCYSLNVLSFPDTQLTIGYQTFYNCYSITDVVFPKNTNVIGRESFMNCKSIKSISILNSSISQNAFANCESISDVTISDSLVSIPIGLFSGARCLQHITLHNNITSIGGSAFNSCDSLMCINIPEYISELNTYTFSSCKSLSSITIPNNITVIGNGVFMDCYGLGYIKFKSTTPPTVANSNAWRNIPTDCKILVPQGTLETYKAAQNYPNPNTYTYEEYTE